MSFQAYLDNISLKTGKKPQEFLAEAGEKGLLAPGVTATQVVSWLKADYGLGHGHAMAMLNYFRQATLPPVTTNERIAKLFTGSKSYWREPYDQLVTIIRAFGPDARTAATDSYISLLRDKAKFGIVQVTGKRLDIGLKLKGVGRTDRLESAGSWNAMVTHRVRITDPAQINAEVITWLKHAYEQA